MAPPAVPTRPFGRSGDRVSILGLGGWHVGVPRTDRAAVKLIHAAIDAGVTFMDNAWDYNDGVSEKRMGLAIADRRDDVFLMTKVCVHGRDGKVAMQEYEAAGHATRAKTEKLRALRLAKEAADREAEAKTGDK